MSGAGTSEVHEGKVHEGGCLCGAVRYRIAGPVQKAAHCHCTMCRKANASVFVTWAVVSRDDFAFTAGAPAVYRSSEHAERRFCPRCGTQLTFASNQVPTRMDVTLGSLDNPELFPADRHVWTSTRISWLHLDDGLAAFPEGTPEGYQPDRRDG